jgi:hypothetical protein
MRVLVACESSGVVRQAFRNRGHDAWSCDLLPADDGSRHHIRGDATARLCDGWDLLIAHPPCTRLTLSGVRWLEERNLWADLDQAAALFRAVLQAPVCQIAVENPIPHGHAMQRIGAEYSQIIQPWQFGHGETKATCLWLRNLPLLRPTRVVEGREARIHSLPPSADRWKLRSVTYAGIAEAMADQWGRAQHYRDPVQTDLFEAA